MTRAEAERALLLFADHVHVTTIYVIGSQACFGSLPDDEIDAVLKSSDIDVYVKPHLQQYWLSAMTQFGPDSDFEYETGHYIDFVEENLPRLPLGWQIRAIRRNIGEITVNGAAQRVEAVYPEIHDVVASKIVIGRPSDIALLDDLVAAGKIDRPTLEVRVRETPRMDTKRLKKALALVALAFRSVE